MNVLTDFQSQAFIRKVFYFGSLAFFQFVRGDRRFDTAKCDSDFPAFYFEHFPRNVLAFQMDYIAGNKIDFRFYSGFLLCFGFQFAQYFLFAGGGLRGFGFEGMSRFVFFF